MNVDMLVDRLESTLTRVLDSLEKKELSSTEKQQLISIGYIGTSDSETADAMIENFVQTVFINPIMDEFARESYENIK